ncbi:nuclear transport factor 2 family protein [bacterium]|nr:MAG: nuclear transport factor 2 family protein [bacterium]
MLRNALADQLLPAADFLAMLADDAVMEFPYAPAGLPHRLEGRAAIGNYLAALSALLAFDRIAQPIVHRTSDRDVTILEFAGFGRGIPNGEPYEQRYISVIRTLNGRIVQYRDYWDPLAVLTAIKGRSATEALTVKLGGHD